MKNYGDENFCRTFLSGRDFMHTFFVNSAQKNQPGDVILLNDSDDCFHIARSLRMAVGEMIKVSDGECQYVCRLTSIHDKECEAEVCEVIGRVGEPPYCVTVYQGLPKGDKLETVIQKSTELGACGIVPFYSDFCTVKPKDAAGEAKKRARRQAIAKEAAKQCGRTVVPIVEEVISFTALQNEVRQADVAVFCYESEEKGTLGGLLASTDLTGKRIAIIVGSEGGFSEKEAAALCDSGAVCVSLGERILRTETAALYVLSALSCRYEL